MDDHAGAIIFGGPMSANDTDDFIRREIDWIGVPLREQQAVSRHLSRRADAGAPSRRRVYQHPDGHAEVGYYPIRPTESGARSATPGPTRSTSGIARASICRRAPNCSPRATAFRCQAFRYGDGLRAAVPSGRDARHDVPVDHARRTSARYCRTPSRGSPISTTARCTIRQAAPGSRRSSITGCAARERRGQYGSKESGPVSSDLPCRSC